MNDTRRFLVLWTLATLAATAAFSVHLGLRVKSVELGYELGRAQVRVDRLREVKRVLELEIASHKTPERVDLVARTLLGMSEPTPDRIIPAGELPAVSPAEEGRTGSAAAVVPSAAPAVEDAPQLSPGPGALLSPSAFPEEELNDAPEPPGAPVLAAAPPPGGAP